MLTELNKMFTESIALEPDVWMIIGLLLVALPFFITLIGGLAAGDYKKSKTLMKKVIATPSTALACMKQMPSSVKQQYKRARVAGLKPSDYVSEDVCVNNLYKRSLVSKIWIVTFVATVISAALLMFVAPFAVTVAYKNIESGATDAAIEASLEYAPYTMPLITVIAGGLLTFIGAIIGKASHSGAVKTYATFVNAVDADAKGAGATAAHQSQAQAQPQTAQTQAGGYPYGAQAEPTPVSKTYEPVTEVQPDYEPMGGNSYGSHGDYGSEHVNEYGYDSGYGEPVNNSYGEHAQGGYAEPGQGGYGEATATPFMGQSMESDDDFRRRAREEAIAQARAAQEAESARAAAAAEAAQAAAAAEAARQAQAQAGAQAAAQAAAQAQAQNSSSSMDAIIARIDQIDREGGSRETMREVATLLQQERAKPENKSPDRQKKLNESLSKLLKAMSAASRK